MSDSLLILWDDPADAGKLARRFQSKGWEVELARDLRTARRKIVDEGFEPLVTLADTELPDGRALDLLDQSKDRRPAGEWVLMTSECEPSVSQGAEWAGIYDVLGKPCRAEKLWRVLHAAGRSALAQRRLDDQRREHGRAYCSEAFVGSSAAARGVRDLLSRLAEVPFSALIIAGETGTGKGLAARILHSCGPRAHGPLVEVNCAALPRELLESELFGHQAGAFTGAKGTHRGYLEQADGGILLLDEISEMDMDLQSKLLKAIEDRTLRRLGGEKEIRVNVQVLAATNQDLEQSVRDGKFRSDLYHRLSVMRVQLPPLRERLEDLEDLVPAMVEELSSVAAKRVRRIPESVYRQMRQYHWPGNVRELRNVVERAVLLADGEVFPEQWLQLEDRLGPAPTGPEVGMDRLALPLDGSMTLDEMEGYIIQTALQRRHYNVTDAARFLGTTRETLRYRILKHHLRTEDPDLYPIPRKAGVG